VTDDELVYVRVVSAPKPLAFECMTDPRHLAAFWGPAGTRTPLDGIVVELHPGGRFETLMVNEQDGRDYRMRAVFDEVIPPDLLSWTDTDLNMSTTVTFTETGSGCTEVRIHQRRVPAALREPDAQAGFLTSLDRFENYLRTINGPRDN
jgi:uncharacterized protein YndB with AHSA1/START domain